MKKFLRTKLKITYDGLAMDIDGFVSDSGATRLFMEGSIPFYLVDALGKEISVRICGVECKAILVLETLRNGAFYGIKFISIPDHDRDHLKNEIESKGEIPAWNRKYPRIQVDEAQSDLPVPNLGLVFGDRGREDFVNVVNFSIEGIRFETYGDLLVNFRVGHQFNFDLMTNRGELLKGFRGEVLNLFESGKVSAPGVPVRRAIGVKFVSVLPESEKKYIELIRDYCLAFKKKFEQK